MGPGAGLIVGIPFVVLTLALLTIFRRERLHSSGAHHSPLWRVFVRVVTVALLAFVGFMVIELLLRVAFGPPHGAGA